MARIRLGFDDGTSLMTSARVTALSEHIPVGWARPTGASPAFPGGLHPPYDLTDRARLPARVAMLLATALLPVGCSEELGPVPMPVTRVRGVVTEGPRPVAGGWIEFIPVDGTVGNLRSARVRSDGSFDADGVAIGENAIRLVQAGIETPAYVRIFGSFASPVRRVIAAESRAPLRIDLVEEAARAREKRSRERAAAAAPAGGVP